MNVQPGTNKWTLVEGEDFERSMERCSASVLTAALEALYAGFPGGFVIPCLLPVMMMLDGLDSEEWTVTSGRRAESPWMTPNRFTSMILWK